MHPLIVLVLIFDVLIAVSSVLNLVNMMRVNLVFSAHGFFPAAL